MTDLTKHGSVGKMTKMQPKIVKGGGSLSHGSMGVGCGVALYWFVVEVADAVPQCWHHYNEKNTRPYQKSGDGPTWGCLLEVVEDHRAH